MRKLDEIAINIELVVVSLIEGIALSTLAIDSADILQTPENWQYIPFLLSGLTIMLVFWSQAILHAISFIRWPLSMGHMLMYFVAVFLQVIAYTNITHPMNWFLWWTVFSVFVYAIYILDLIIIKQTIPAFEVLSGGGTYIRDVLKRHVFEMRFLVPLSIAFNVVALGLILYGGPFFQTPQFYVGVGTLQFLVSLGALIDCVRNFKSRSAMLPALFGE